MVCHARSISHVDYLLHRDPYRCRGNDRPRSFRGIYRCLVGLLAGESSTRCAVKLDLSGINLASEYIL